MKTTVVTLVTILLTLSACGGSKEMRVQEELDKSWSEMSAEDRSFFCTGYYINSEKDFRDGAVKRFGEANADAAIAWAKETCK